MHRWTEPALRRRRRRTTRRRRRSSASRTPCTCRTSSRRPPARCAAAAAGHGAAAAPCRRRVSFASAKIVAPPPAARRCRPTTTTRARTRSARRSSTAGRSTAITARPPDAAAGAAAARRPPPRCDRRGRVLSPLTAVHALAVVHADAAGGHDRLRRADARCAPRRTKRAGTRSRSTSSTPRRRTRADIRELLGGSSAASCGAASMARNARAAPGRVRGGDAILREGRVVVALLVVRSVGERRPSRKASDELLSFPRLTPARMGDTPSRPAAAPAPHRGR